MEENFCTSATRLKTEVTLIGKTEATLPINVLPTGGHTLCTFLVFYHHKILKKTVREFECNDYQVNLNLEKG